MTAAELRVDPLRGHRVVVSRARSDRPNQFATWVPQPDRLVQCPFCAGNERETPPEVAAVRPPGSPANGPGWSLRVIPNRYPAVCLDAEASQPAPVGHPVAPAHGRHEVVIETPEHTLHLADFPAAQRLLVLSAYRDRVRALTAAGLGYVVVFRNAGPRSGASLVHPHTQIVALQTSPPPVQHELEALRRHRERTGRCLACDLVRDEEADGRRWLAEAGDFVAYLPYAGRFPGETIVTARAHPVAFAALTDADLATLGTLLAGVLGRLRRRFSEPSMNLVLHGAVPEAAALDGHHWRIEVLPRVAQMGGFELGTGTFINGLPPEEAAAGLRAS